MRLSYHGTIRAFQKGTIQSVMLTFSNGRVSKAEIKASPYRPYQKARVADFDKEALAWLDENADQETLLDLNDAVIKVYHYDAYSQA